MSENKGLGYVDARLDEVDAWDGAVSMVNPGEYILEVEKVEGGTSNSSKPKMVLNYKVVEALDEVNDDQIGRSIIQSQSLDLSNDAVRKRLKSLITALLGKADSRGGFDPNDLLGKQMVAEVSAETYTKSNPITGEPTERETIKVIRERHISVLDDVEGDVAAEPEPEPEPEPKSARGRRRAANASPRAN